MSDILLQMLAYASTLFWEQIMKPMQNEKLPIYLMIAVRTGKAMLDSPAGVFWNTGGSSSVTTSVSTSTNGQSTQKEMLSRSEIERVVLTSFKHIFQYASEQAGISIGLSQVGYFPSSIAFGTYFEQFPLLFSSSGTHSGVYFENMREFVCLIVLFFVSESRTAHLMEQFRLLYETMSKTPEQRELEASERHRTADRYVR